MIPLPPRDPALGAMDVALDGAAMAALLDRQLPGCAAGALRVRACRPTWVKYEPGKKYIVDYELELYDLASGTTTTTLAHATLLRGGRAAKQWSKPAIHQLVSDAAALHPDPPAGRAAFLPEMPAIMQLYPVDLELPGLVQAVSTKIGARLGDALPMSNGQGLEAPDITLVRYKPARRAVLRYQPRGAPCGGVYGKLIASGDGERHVAIGRALRAAGVVTPAPLAYLSDLGMLVLQLQLW